MKLYLKGMILASFFAALTAICAQIYFYTPFSASVPFTLQIFVVLLSGVILGSMYGALSQLVYLLIGIIGVPVFAGFQGGISVLYGPLGGYLLSFPVIALVVGLIVRRKKQVSRLAMGFMFVISIIICYIFGSVQLAFVVKISYVQAIIQGVLPFIAFDLIKAVAAAFLGYAVRNALIKANQLPLSS